MAAEQRGCRETLRVHSEWLSVREQRESEERDRKEKDIEELEGDRTLGRVYCVLYCSFWGAVAEFNVSRWSTPVYIPSHALAQGHCRANGHWLHGEQTTARNIQLVEGLQLTIILISD